MPAPVNAFKAGLVSGRTLFGTWLMTGSTQAAEGMGHAGYDFLVVDTEHVPIDLGQTFQLLQAVGNTPASPVVRLPWNDAVTMKRILDMGAQTVMVPFVETAEEARAAVASTRYPPDGVRGIAAMTRASRFGTAGDYLKTANDEMCVIVQLETPGAIARMAEIAAVPGVDALFVGPGDLSGALGFIGEIGRAEVQEALKNAAATARSLGKPIGIVGPTPAMVTDFLRYGFTFTAVASDLAMMMTRGREYLAALRGVDLGPAKSESVY